MPPSNTETVTAAVAGGGAGGILPEEQPPIADFIPPPPPAGRQISTLSARSYSYGSVEVFDSLMQGHLKRGYSDCSFLSDFEIVTFGGTTQRRCKTCSFLNKDKAMICQGCQVGLISSTDVDEQIARNLQQKEDLQAITARQDKRQHLWQEGPLAQAQFLAQEVIQIASLPEFREASYETFPDLDLTMAAARFLQAVQQQQEMHHETVSVAFTFAHKSMVESVRIHGFPDNTKVCINPSVARGKCLLSTGKTTKEENGTVGFIVAIVAPNFVEVDQDTSFAILDVPRSSQCLPLVHFDVHKTPQLFDLLEVGIADFFMTIRNQTMN